MTSIPPPNPKFRRLADWLCVMREKSGMDLHMTARAAGLRPNELAHLESGQPLVYPDAKVLGGLARLYEVPLDMLEDLLREHP